MKTTQILALVSIVVVAFACTSGENTVEDLEARLQKKLEERAAIDQEIAELQQEIQQAGGDTRIAEKGIPVTVLEVEQGTFRHPIEVQGVITSDENITLSAEAGGRVTRISVDEGDRVRKGQLLVSLDAQPLINQIAEVQNQLDLAEITFQKQERLWKQNIGSEMQYLEAKNRKESLQRQIATLNSQLARYRLTSPISGMVEDIMVNEGEMTGPGTPVIQIVDAEKVKVKADVSEKYVGSLHPGDSVTVIFPALGEERKATLSAVGQVIQKGNRTFSVMVELDNKNKKYKPNLLAVVRAYDKVIKDVVVIPTDLVSMSGDRSYVYVAEQTDSTIHARKVWVETGITDNGVTVITKGLEPGTRLIRKGSKGISDGELIRIVADEPVATK